MKRYAGPHYVLFRPDAKEVCLLLHIYSRNNSVFIGTNFTCQEHKDETRNYWTMAKCVNLRAYPILPQVTEYDDVKYVYCFPE